MKKSLSALFLLALASLSLASSAWAHGPRHSHGRIGIHFGNPWIYAPYPAYFPSYYPRSYYPPVVITQPEPQPVYIEQPQQAAPAAPPPPQASAPAAETQYWYYCAASAKYHPYVRDCPEGWLKVVPQTPPPNAPR